jgi:hypothetical protein
MYHVPVQLVKLNLSIPIPGMVQSNFSQTSRQTSPTSQLDDPFWRPTSPIQLL